MSKPTHIIYLQESSRNTKKWMVTITKDGDRNFTVHFGGKGYSDYTLHKDPDRMMRYEARHNTKEDWGKSGIKTAGFWSKWLLWNLPSLNKSIKDTETRFGIKIHKRPPK